MDVSSLTHPSSIVAVLAVLTILLSNIWLYRKTKLAIFLWYTGAWSFAFCVRTWIMITDLWPDTVSFKDEYYVLNALMAFAYILIAIGTIIKVKAIHTIITNGIQSVLKGKGKK